MRKKILILGGTKYVGKALLNELISNNDNQITVLSRHRIEKVTFIEGNRKNQALLLDIFKDEYDIVIDFICFCLPDAAKLLKAIQNNGTRTKIIFISTTYVYDQNAPQNVYTELDFNPIQYKPSYLEREQISYQEGKKSAEAYFVQNMSPKDLCILRFPIILGKNDYTLRTRFFTDFIINGGDTNQIPVAGSSNFIFVQDIVAVLIYLIENFTSGTYNVVRPESFSQRDLAEIYKSIIEPSESSKKIRDLESTPFFYESNFKIDGSKFDDFYTFEETFVTRLSSIIHS